jgi:hypothetical protein
MRSPDNRGNRLSSDKRSAVTSAPSGGSFVWHPARIRKGPLARSIPFGCWFIRLVDGVDLDHPLEAGERCAVFEFRPLREGPLAASTGR